MSYRNIYLPNVTCTFIVIFIIVYTSIISSLVAYLKYSITFYCLLTLKVCFVLYNIAKISSNRPGSSVAVKVK